MNRLGTLTYGESVWDPARARRDIGGFFVELRAAIGQPFPYAWVPEPHPGGHGLHLHFGIGRYVKWTLIREAWAWGSVTDIRRLGDGRFGSGEVEESRTGARYLAKYIGKDLHLTHSFGLHRFDVAQGFQPEKEFIYGPTEHDVVELASKRMGASPEYVWRSRQADQWSGPDAVWLAWQ